MYTESLALCNGTNAGIVGLKTCTVPLLGLRAAPYLLVLGDDVFVQLTAHNFYGDSPMSTPGNGAKIVYPPDAPLSVSDDTTVTNDNRVGLTWVDGVSNGGTPVIDYEV